MSYKIIHIILLSLSWVTIFGQDQKASSHTKNSISIAAHSEGNIEGTDLDVNTIGLLKANFPQLDGRSIAISLKENMPDITDIDIHQNIKQTSYSSNTISQHATNIAIILSGRGITSASRFGVTPEAKLFCANFSNLLPESDDFYRANNIVAVNHSYGTTIENFYSNNTKTFDQSTFNNPSLLHVFSSGNLGYASGTNMYNNIPGFANLTGSFKQGKNSLVVGAVDWYGIPYPSSSAGPVYDGRLKPELCAYSEEGSSGSAALVTGTVALLQQYYFSKFNVYADASLLKAVLINSATDIGQPGMDWKSGYGNMNAYEAMRTLDESRYEQGVVVKDQVIEIPITIPDNAINLKVTLCWTDPAAEQNSTTALVNDLNLEIIGTRPCLPWVLSSYPNVDSLRAPAKRRQDHLNVVEQVTIEHPEDQNYSVRITSESKQQQAFSIAYQWDIAENFQWISPVKNKTVSSNTYIGIRWKSTLKETSASLEYSLDKGVNWNLINDNVDLSAEMYEWNCPDTLARVLLRIKTSEHTFINEEFTISPQVNITSDFRCSDSLKMSWNVLNVSAYRLYRLNQTSLAWIDNGIVPENEITIHIADNNDIFAVSPIAKSGFEGIRSDALQLGKDETRCFYNQLNAYVVNDSITIQCQLTSPKWINKVVFESLQAGKFNAIDSNDVMPLGAQYYTTIDPTPREGINNYRIQIILKDGRTIYSDIVSVSRLKERQFILYPNPAENKASITILARDADHFSFRLFDGLGRQAVQHDIYEQEKEVSIENLKPGMYLYQLYSDSGIKQTGRLVIK